MRKLFHILFASVACILMTGCGADSAMKKGDKFFALGEYYDAAEQYKKAYSQTKATEKSLRGQRAPIIHEKPLRRKGHFSFSRGPERFAAGIFA